MVARCSKTLESRISKQRPSASFWCKQPMSKTVFKRGAFVTLISARYHGLAPWSLPFAVILTAPAPLSGGTGSIPEYQEANEECGTQVAPKESCHHPTTSTDRQILNDDILFQAAVSFLKHRRNASSRRPPGSCVADGCLRNALNCAKSSFFPAITLRSPSLNDRHRRF